MLVVDEVVVGAALLIQQADLVVQEEVVQVLLVKAHQLPVLMVHQILVEAVAELVEDFLLIQLMAVQVVQVL